jgi:hypothetical protein
LELQKDPEKPAEHYNPEHKNFGNRRNNRYQNGDDPFMAARRIQREEIGETGVKSLWASSPKPQSDRLVMRK